MRPLPAWLARPAAALYGLGVGLRNRWYDRGMARSWTPPVPTVVVGNLSVGGTGKTPMVMALVEWFRRQGRRPAVVSRGYGRKSRGLVDVRADASFEVVGDEPLLIKRRYPDVPVVVSADRRAGIEYLWGRHQPEVVIMDDGFQHRRIRPHVAVVLMPYHRPYDRDRLLPWGRLREPLASLQRADALVVTKVPERHPERVAEWRGRLGLPADFPVFEVPFRYGRLAQVSGPPLATIRKPLVVAGIADPQPLAAYVADRFPAAVMRFFPDHYAFTASDVASLWAAAHRRGCDAVLTTEKDRIRLEGHVRGHAVPVFVLPVMPVPGADLQGWLGGRLA